MFMRKAALAALLATAAPVAAQAATASASYLASFQVVISAPGATISVFDEDGFSQTFAGGTGSAFLNEVPSPFAVSDPANLSSAQIGVASAFSPAGTGSVLSEAFALIDVANETQSDITATVNYTLSGNVFADADGDNAFAGAFSEAGLFAALQSGSTSDDVSEDFFLFADSEFGPSSDSEFVSGLAMFTIAPGDLLFVDPFAGGDALAVVVPVPPAIAFGLTGLLGLGILRARRG